MAELQKGRTSCNNPSIINSTYNLYDDLNFTTRISNGCFRIFNHWINTNVEEIWGRRTVKTLDSYDAAELQELFNDKYEEDAN